MKGDAIMVIAVKSEVDSRVLLYPLLRAVKHYGNILVISSNTALRRLVDSEDEGGFRNIRIIVDEEGATDDILEGEGITEQDFDFIILDNMGMINHDVCFVPIGIAHSESFDEDVKALVREEPEKVYVVQFGRKPKQEGKLKDRKTQQTDEDWKPEDKFKKADQAVQKNPITVAPWPTYETIEAVEATHYLPVISDALVKLFYDVFKNILAVDFMKYKKEVAQKDDCSGYIKSINTVWEE